MKNNIYISHAYAHAHTHTHTHTHTQTRARTHARTHTRARMHKEREREQVVITKEGIPTTNAVQYSDNQKVHPLPPVIICIPTTSSVQHPSSLR